MSLGPRKLCLRVAVLASTLLLLTPPAARSSVTIVDFTWTGKGSFNYWTDSDNWAGGLVPTDNLSTDNIIFGNVQNTQVDYSTIFVYKLSFIGHTRSYDLDGGIFPTTHIGSGGIVYSPASSVTSVIHDNIQLEDSQEWNITNGTLVIDGSISDQTGIEPDTFGNFSITKTGAGTLVLQSANSFSWTGGVNLNAGQIALSSYDGTNNALGQGTLTINGGTLVAMLDENEGEDSAVVIANNIVVSNGLLSTINEAELHLAPDGEGDFVHLNTDTVVQVKGRPLVIGSITDDGDGYALTMNSTGVLILDGYNNYTGGTTVTKGILAFGNANAIPNNHADSVPLSVGAQGYMSIAFDPVDLESSIEISFLTHFDRANSSGSIGFDTPDESFSQYDDDIDLTGFHADARLGSASQAILTGTITPQGGTTDPYRFGGGGGLLIVSSQLSDAGRAVVVDSPAETPLTLGLGSLNVETDQPFFHAGNAFAGGVTARYSAVIFGPGAMPAAGNFTLDDGGYIGTANTDSENFQVYDVGAFIARFPTGTNRGMIGFDYFGGGTAVVSNDNEIPSDIDLSGFTGGAVYLGTATSALFGPNLTITPQGATYRFAGYKDGELEVATSLEDDAGARSVVIGDPTSPATFGDFFEREYSTVALTGDNSYTGGTTFWGGRLVVGQSNGTPGVDPTSALGTGTLTVNAFPFASFPGVQDQFTDEIPAPQLEVNSFGLIIPNNLMLGTTLNIGGVNDLTLAGTITGGGGLYVGEDGYIELTLAGENSFGGGVYVEGESSVIAVTDTALGIGPLKFGFSGGNVIFESPTPVVHGIFSDTNAEIELTHDTDARLTIIQNTDSVFRGSLRADNGIDEYDGTPALIDSHDGVFVKSGTGTLRLEDGYVYAYGQGPTKEVIEVQQGTLVLSNYYFESGSVSIKVNGGTLALDSGMTLSNPVILQNNSRLAGYGHFTSDITLVSGATLAPGLANQGGIGFLDIDHLNVLGGSAYEWNLLGSADPATSPHDMIQIGSADTLDFSGIDVIANPVPTTANRFTLKAISLQADGTPGMAGGFLPEQTYSWMLFSYISLIDGVEDTVFDPAKIIIDPSLFFTNLGTGFGAGTFSVTDGGGYLTLNFTAVPEPSTYALLALGLGLLGLTAWRKRRT